MESDQRCHQFLFSFSFLKANIETKGYYKTLELDGFGIQN
jgi:hypothetical protein